MPKLLMTPAETAECLSMSRSTVYELLRAGVLESTLRGRRRLIFTSSIEAYVDSLREEARQSA